MASVEGLICALRERGFVMAKPRYCVLYDGKKVFSGTWNQCRNRIEHAVFNKVEVGDMPAGMIGREATKMRRRYQIVRLT